MKTFEVETSYSFLLSLLCELLITPRMMYVLSMKAS